MTQYQEEYLAEPTLKGNNSTQLSSTSDDFDNHSGKADSCNGNKDISVDSLPGKEYYQNYSEASLSVTNKVSDDKYSDEVLLSSESTLAPSRRFGMLKGLFLGTAFTGTAIVSGLLGVVVSFTVPLAEAIAPTEDTSTSVADLWRKGIRHQVVRPVNILVMGIDKVSVVEPPEQQQTLSSSPTAEPHLTDDNTSQSTELAGNAAGIDKFSGRSDTMLLVQVNPEQNTVNVLSIPRDTQVEFPGRSGVTKINHANLIGGPRLAADVVSHNLNGVSIDRYVRVNTAAFRELVDALGGVEILVPQPMKYTDKTQGLYIDLEEGRQFLTGEEAEQFARFRSDGNGDIGRVQRQQQLIRALRDRVMTPTIVPSLPSILQVLREHIDTNLTTEELLSLLNFALDLESDQFRMVMLPGQFSRVNEYIASYWLMDKAAIDRVMADYFQVRPKKLAAQLGIGRQESKEDAFKSLRIVIQNASGDPAATQQLTRILLNAGFTRVYRSLAWSPKQVENPQPTTKIIVQGGDLESAERLQKMLSTSIIVPASIGDLHSDLTLRIGEDWVNFYEQISESQE
ncbi:MAG: LCP family protein [Cyanobacteria bacterium P01_F01_bin.150]